MLGRLLSSAISSNTANVANPQIPDFEDSYTRGLLYPDVLSDLSSSPSFSNLNDHLSISDSSRNVRIIVAQDGSGSEQKAIIYDTDPVINWNDYRLKDRGGDRYANGALSADLKPRRRSAALSSPGIHGPNEDEMKVLMECMFGSSVLAYKGPSIKFHVLPSAPPTTSRAPAARRHSSKTSSFARADPVHQDALSANTDRNSRSVLITRTFSVLVPLPQLPEAVKAASNAQPCVNGSAEEAMATPKTSQTNNNSSELKGFPFPALNNSPGLKQPRPQKSITYAVALVITIPGPSMPTTTPVCRTKRTSPENTNPQDIPRNTSQSSLWKAREETFDGLIDDRMDIITKNWDVITRTLCEMQVVLAKQIIEALQKRVIMSPSIMQNPYSYKTMLLPGALMNDRVIVTEVDRMKWRVVSGFKIARVMTGQGRWAAWRDEAKWAGQSFGGRDNHFFFLTLLTAFLGCHTDWLDILGPRDYRRKHKQRQVTGKDDTNIRSRTIIICGDKIAARKLVYLLSAFLPSRSSPTTHWNADRQHAFPSAGLNEDTLNFSQSPPQTRSDAKKEIRRIPSKLSIVEGIDENKASNSWNILSSSAVSVHHVTDESPKTDVVLSSSVDRKQLPIPVLSPRNYNSTITTAAATPQATVLSSSFKYYDGENRPGSSGSSISVNNLRQTLRRNGTGPNAGYANESSGSNGWGSFISSIWSNPRSRGSFSGASSASTTADDIGNIDARLGSRRAEDDFATMFASSHSDNHDDTRLHSLNSPKWGPDVFPGHNFEESTLRYSIDEEGVVDVDIPMGIHAGFSSDKSFGFSPMNSSPTSTSQFESSMESSLISLSALTLLPPLPPATGESESTGNVAGEVDRFHPDFVLQAVKPYAGLEREIRKAMKAELIPQTSSNQDHHSKSDNQWVDVCVTLIADTNKNQIRSLKLRRRRLDATNTSTLNNTATEIKPALHEKHANDQFQEEIVEEIVMDMDEALATAVEGVVSNTVPAGALPCKSRSSSVASGRSRTRNPQYEKNASVLPPRECRTIVLGALEKVAQQVLDQPRGLVHNILTEGIASWLREVEDGGSV